MESADLLRMVVSLLGIILILFAAAWLMRKAGWAQKPAKHDAIRLLGTKRVGARGSIALVEIADTRLILGITPQSISLLHSQPANSPATAPANDETGFRPVLQRHLDPDRS